MLRRPKAICAIVLAWLLLLGAGVIVTANGWRILLTVRTGISLLVILLGPLLAYGVASARTVPNVALAATGIAVFAATLKTYLLLFEHGPSVVLLGVVECFAIAGLWLFAVLSSLGKSNDA